MKKRNLFLLFTLPLLLLSACIGEQREQPVELMYEHLEESVQIEKSIEQNQGPLTEAEQHEVKLYEEMLTISSIEEIEPIANEAIQSAESRRSLMEKEKELILEAFESFQFAEEHVELIENEEERKLADELIQIMYDRYDSYLALYDTYIDSIDYDIELYQMVKGEDVEIEELQEQHEKVNTTYEIISELNKKFNELTSDYNDAKVAFYQESELEVIFE